MNARQVAVRVLMVMLFCFFSMPAEAAHRAHGRAKTVQVKKKAGKHKKRHGRTKAAKAKRHHAKAKRHHR
jgi:hypothetical protein